MTQSRKKYILSAFACVLVLVVAAYVRLVNLEHNPGWFTDEATHLEVARNLQNGRVQYLAITGSTLLFSRLPLFEWLLTGMAELFGLSMTALRLLTGSLGLFSVGMLGFVTWRLSRDVIMAWLAAFMLAIYPPAVVTSRFGFSYNLLAPFLLLACLALWEFKRTKSRKWLLLAAMSIGLGMLSDLWMLAYVPVFVLVVAWRDWRALAWSLPLLLLPFGLYTAVSLLTVPDAFLFDLNFVLFRLSLPLAGQLKSLGTNVTTLISQDGWMALGLVGLFAIRPLPRRRFLLLFTLLPLIILARSTALHSLGFHYMIPLLPFVALGLAALLRYGVPVMVTSLKLPWAGGTAVSYFLTAAIIGIPMIATMGLLWGQVNGRFQTAIDPFLVNGRDAQAVAEYINQHLDKDDLVIATSTITWMLRTNRADFQMSVAVQGQATPHLPANIPQDRYAFNPDYRQAAVVVIDNWWYTWGQFHVPGVPEMIEEVTGWPLLYTSGDIHVYGNPHASPITTHYGDESISRFLRQ